MPLRIMRSRGLSSFMHSAHSKLHARSRVNDVVMLEARVVRRPPDGRHSDGRVLGSTSMFVCPECGASQQAPGHCGADGSLMADSADDMLLGMTVGAYRIARLLGVGGMG